AVRVSRDKVNKVAHAVTEALAEVNELDFVEDRNTIRLEVRRVMEELLNQEEKIDQSARHKIENQKRTILEGSQEWDILYRKYYQEEVKKLGV
ncbi:MAG: DUF507 family protein, partial [Terriglobales bacterium]